MMVQKQFYKAFGLLYEKMKNALNLYQKEAFYRLLFRPVYALIDDEMYDNDSIRKITSGNQTIHLKVIKRLHTIEGFECFRSQVEHVCVKRLEDPLRLMGELLLICEETEGIPEQIYAKIKGSADSDNAYQISRTISAVLICLNYADYQANRKNAAVWDTEFMRLEYSQPLATYPRLITAIPHSVSVELIGRENEINTIYQEVVENTRKLTITGVGGLGKTALIQQFLNRLLETEVMVCGVEQIAWIPYDNQDLCVSMQQSLKLRCEPDEVWRTVQDMCAEQRERLLLVVDNIESIKDDVYLKRLADLPCRILVTSRYKELTGFHRQLELKTLSQGECRELFYRHYQFKERDNETLNEIIDLTARLTIMIVFLAKAAYLEGFSLSELYTKLVESGFKLSEEDVACEHERMQNDETIIRQMCILFSLVRYNEADKSLLTNIALIPNLQFDFPKAKKWFRVQKNSALMKLYSMGMLEHAVRQRRHLYWMHSVIAAAVREQQKEKLYDMSNNFVEIMMEELESSRAQGREYEKAYLIPFSWSVADILEGRWNRAEDAEFLTSLFHICFSCSNYKLCEKLIDWVIEIQKNIAEFPIRELVFSYRNKLDLLLQFDRANEASILFEELDVLFEKNNAVNEKSLIDSQYGFWYQIRGDFHQARLCFERCLQAAEAVEDPTDRSADIATACSNLARMLMDAGEFVEAYNYIHRAINESGKDEENSDLIISYSTLAAICTELMNAGFGTTYVQEAADAFEKVIRFRETKLGMHHADTAVAYHDYAYFWYICGVYDKALEYNEKASRINEELFSAHSITRLRSLNTTALVYKETGKKREADNIFRYIIETAEEMSSDYLGDLADFALNYAQSLREDGKMEEASIYYEKCILIWTKMSDQGNRKLAVAHQEVADILFEEGDVKNALLHYDIAQTYNAEDFYIEVEIIDSMAACLLLGGRIDEGIQKLVSLLRILVQFNAHDDETKFDLCRNLACVIEANSEEEKLWKEKLMNSIRDEVTLVDYVHNYITNEAQKQNIARHSQTKE